MCLDSGSAFENVCASVFYRNCLPDRRFCVAVSRWLSDPVSLYPHVSDSCSQSAVGYCLTLSLVMHPVSCRILSHSVSCHVSVSCIKLSPGPVSLFLMSRFRQLHPVSCPIPSRSVWDCLLSRFRQLHPLAVGCRLIVATLEFLSAVGCRLTDTILFHLAGAAASAVHGCFCYCAAVACRLVLNSQQMIRLLLSL